MTKRIASKYTKPERPVRCRNGRMIADGGHWSGTRHSASTSSTIRMCLTALTGSPSGDY
ncbi:hypothetical protein DPMN_093771 [Dreissena polymorpha]|uniref:Uncharacterized protein n=1 Tax=Dreissena polymorpha TaxID=45954 RepID=A0A9D4L6D1_DREPO|nr:hypothetical protein DPMN_093771 [Dreissena polymorpha]